MPLLRLGKERLDPDLALPDRLLISLCLVIAPDLLEVVDVERPLHLAAVVAGGALGLHRAGIADSDLTAVRHHALGSLDRVATQGMVLRAAVPITLRIEDEVVMAVETGAVREVGQGQIGADAGVFDGDDVLGGPVLGIPGDVVRPDPPAKADAPQEIAQRHVLHHVSRGDQRSENDPTLTAIDDVLVVGVQCRAGAGAQGVASGSVVLTRKSVVRRSLPTAGRCGSKRRSSSSCQRGAGFSAATVAENSTLTGRGTTLSGDTTSSRSAGSAASSSSWSSGARSAANKSATCDLASW